VAEAIEVLKLNVEAHPQSANAYDSLGEAYKIQGSIKLAVQNYKKSLELNPGNRNAESMLKELEEESQR
jgi:cytochrome c-type biogenesis protein CcmH/NrfG